MKKTLILLLLASANTITMDAAKKAGKLPAIQGYVNETVNSAESASDQLSAYLIKNPTFTTDMLKEKLAEITEYQKSLNSLMAGVKTLKDTTLKETLTTSIKDTLKKITDTQDKCIKAALEEANNYYKDIQWKYDGDEIKNDPTEEIPASLIVKALSSYKKLLADRLAAINKISPDLDKDLHYKFRFKELLKKIEKLQKDVAAIK